MKNWTEHEIRLLKDELKKKTTQKKIAQKLGRTYRAIRHKINKLVVSKARSGTRLIDGLKCCNNCGLAKEAKEFHSRQNTIDKKHGTCKACVSISRRVYKYNLTVEELNNKLKLQNGGCAICLTTKRLNLDHCHESGKVRGFLCTNCNLLIGYTKDSVTTLEKAINYLKNWS